jgi:vacuole morphology and inheritance protein 14
LIKDIVSELSTTYVSPYGEPFNTIETDGNELKTPSSLPRNTAFSLPRFIPLLSQRIYVRNSAARQFLVSWMCVLDSIPDLELISFLPEFLDGLIRCLNDVSEDVRVATSGLLQDFLIEIKEAAAVRLLQLDTQQKEKSLIKEKQEKVTSEEVSVEKSGKEADEEEGKEAGEEEGMEGEEEQEDKEDKANVDGEETAADEEEKLGSENDGNGKGTYVPGQGVVVQYGKIVEILVPHLSSSEEEIQKTALLWINAFIEIAKDVIITFTPEIIKAVLPSLAHPVAGIRVIALETNQNLQRLVLETPIHVPEPTTSKSDPSGGMQKAQFQQSTYSQIIDGGDPFDYQATVANLRLQFLNQHEETRVASLDWLLMLHKKAPNKVKVLNRFKRRTFY